MKKNSSTPNAFTLVEVLATVLLISIVIPVAMKGITLSTRLASHSKRQIQAVYLAKRNERIVHPLRKIPRIPRDSINRRRENGFVRSLIRMSKRQPIPACAASGLTFTPQPEKIFWFVHI